MTSGSTPPLISALPHPHCHHLETSISHGRTFFPAIHSILLYSKTSVSPHLLRKSHRQKSISVTNLKNVLLFKIKFFSP